MAPHSFFFSSRRRHTRFDCDWSSDVCSSDLQPGRQSAQRSNTAMLSTWAVWRSEEHTSELQSQSNLVCRLLLEKKKNFSDYLAAVRQTVLDGFRHPSPFGSLIRKLNLPGDPN